MKELNLNFNNKIAGRNYNVGRELATSLQRINIRDEAGIRKIQIYIDYLNSGEPFKLDDVDFVQFKEVVIACDLWHGIKMQIINVYDKIEKE